MDTSWLKVLWYPVVLVIFVLHIAECEKLLHSITDVVPGGNFSYYQIKTRGCLRLELVSHSGDADLYISSETTHPNYDNYDLKSTTCGDDSVDISSVINRPISVSVYGNPVFFKEDMTIKYTLSVYFVTEADDIDYARLDAMYNSMTDDSGAQSQDPSSKTSPSDSHVPEEEEESFLWTIVITILKILFDILL